MNFKKFNGSTWETVRHKRYGSGTDSLTAFPAVIQASGEALTDYTISGNTIQNGTPTPGAPVDVVGCGVWDETYQSYKLTPTVNVTEHPIYLGQVETTRRIKKLVLDGTENWQIDGGKVGLYSATNESLGITDLIQSYAYQLSSHFVLANSYNTIFYNTGYFAIQTNRLIISYFEKQSVNNFKSWLQQQYAAGTPATIWYVLAEPETGIVNEPLHRIGDYADTITMAQAEVAIPTSDGDNTITFGTSVQPSGMSATFKGWHPVQGAKTYDGNDWS